MRILLGLVLLASMFGCASKIKLSDSVAPVADAATALDAYQRVLKKFVNPAGEVDFKALAADMKDLEVYIRYVSETPFSSFGNRDELLAHHLNAYNALSMYTVIRKDIPKTNAGLGKVFFFLLTKLKIGGEWMSLSTYENEYIRKMNEDRIHWALNCMAVSCPRLPQEIFRASTLQADLQKLSVEFFNSPTHVRVVREDKQLFVTEILKFFPEDFVPTKAPSIPAYVNLYRSEKVAEDLTVKYIPYDWTINDSNRRR